MRLPPSLSVESSIDDWLIAALRKLTARPVHYLSLSFELLGVIVIIIEIIHPARVRPTAMRGSTKNLQAEWRCLRGATREIRDPSPGFDSISRRPPIPFMRSLMLKRPNPPVILLRGPMSEGLNPAP